MNKYVLCYIRKPGFQFQISRPGPCFTTHFTNTRLMTIFTQKNNQRSKQLFKSDNSKNVWRSWWIIHCINVWIGCSVRALLILFCSVSARVLLKGGGVDSVYFGGYSFVGAVLIYFYPKRDITYRCKYMSMSLAVNIKHVKRSRLVKSPWEGWPV